MVKSGKAWEYSDVHWLVRVVHLWDDHRTLEVLEGALLAVGVVEDVDVDVDVAQDGEDDHDHMELPLVP